MSVNNRIYDAFVNEGYCILRRVLSKTVLDSVRIELEAMVDLEAERLVASGRIADPLRDAPFEKRLYWLYKDHLEIAPKSFRNNLHGAGFFDLFFNTVLLDVVESYLGPEIRLYPNYTARPKFPDWEGTLVLWHQDGGYTASVNSDDAAVGVLRMVNVWAPLVPARVDNGCMQFVPGTHKLGVVPHRQREHYLEIAPIYIEPRLKDAVNVETDPGDVVLFHNLLFHQGLPNASDGIRWSLDWRYQDATQPTMRAENGHLARSSAHPESVVSSGEKWAGLALC